MALALQLTPGSWPRSPQASDCTNNNNIVRHSTLFVVTWLQQQDCSCKVCELPVFQ